MTGRIDVPFSSRDPTRQGSSPQTFEIQMSNVNLKCKGVTANGIQYSKFNEDPRYVIIKLVCYCICNIRGIFMLVV